MASHSKLDDRPLRPEPYALAAGIFETRRAICQQVETPRIFLLQTLGCLEPVDDDRIAAIYGILEAGENLQCRHRITIGIVGMRLEAEIGVSEVAGIDLRPHLEPAPIVRLPNKAEELGDRA